MGRSLGPGRQRLSRVRRVLGLGAGFLAANLRSRPAGLRRRPNAMCVFVTYRCNMRCRMCGIWAQREHRAADELSVGDFRRVLSDPLFSSLDFININGGEPNLRPDLVELAALFFELFPRLRSLSLNSNGLPAQTCVRNIERMSELCRKRGSRFSVSISLHDVGEPYDAIAGIPQAYDRVMESLRELRAAGRVQGFYLGVNCVITPLNSGRLPELLAWGEREKIPVNFTLGEVRDRFYNTGSAPDVLVPEESRPALAAFLRGLGRKKSLYLQHALRYAQLAEIIERGARRTLACHYALGGVILGSDGLLYYCKNSRPLGDARSRSAEEIYFDERNISYKRDELFKTVCPACPPNTYNLAEVKKDLLKILAYLALGWR